MKSFLAAVLLPFIACANPHNSWQGLQPARGNYIASITAASPYPQASNIIIYAPLTSSVTATTGGQPTFSRASSVKYASTPSLLSTVTSGNPAVPATFFDATDSAYGWQAFGKRYNPLTYSKDLSNAAWTKLGSATISSDANTDPLGATGWQKITGSGATSGVEQDCGDDAATPDGFTERGWTGGAFFRTSSGTATITISMRDSTSSEIGQTQLALTTTPHPYEVYKGFGPNATGHAFFKVVVGNTSNVLMYGASCQHNFSDWNARSYGGVGPYIETTSSGVTTETDRLVFPAATVDQAINEGTICANWKPAVDANQQLAGGAKYLFEWGSDLLAVNQTADPPRLKLRYNGSETAISDYWEVAGKNYHNHICASWKRGSNSYKLYRMGLPIASDTSALSAFSSGSDLYFGGDSGATSYSKGDGIFRDFVMWKVQLSDAEVLEAYNVTAEAVAPPEPGTGKLFEVDLGVSPLPTTATDKQYWYMQDSPAVYADSTTTLATAANGVPPSPAYPLNSTNVGGMLFQTNNSNFLLQSENIGTTWATTGTPVVLANVGTFLGTISYGTIAGIANDGITQPYTTDDGTTKITAASRDVVTSVYASVAAATLSFKICNEGDSGGTPESDCETKTATTTPQRFYNRTLFTSAATGSVQTRIILNGVGTLLLGGAMGEKRQEVGFMNIAAPGAYIKTTTTVARTTANRLIYNGLGNINPKKGAHAIWATIDADSSEIINSDGPIFICNERNTEAFCLHMVRSDLKFKYAGENVAETTISFSKNEYHQFGMEWDNTTNPGTFAIWFDGAAVDTGTATPQTPALTNFGIGNTQFIRETDSMKGIIKKVTTWGEKATHIADDWAANHAAYGR